MDTSDEGFFILKMLYSIKDSEVLEKLNDLVSLEGQIKAVRLQDKLGKQNFHQNIKRVFPPVTDTFKNTSENLTKTFTETSVKNNKALEKKTSSNKE